MVKQLLVLLFLPCAVWAEKQHEAVRLINQAAAQLARDCIQPGAEAEGVLECAAQNYNRLFPALEAARKREPKYDRESLKKAWGEYEKVTKKLDEIVESRINAGKDSGIRNTVVVMLMQKNGADIYEHEFLRALRDTTVVISASTYVKPATVRSLFTSHYVELIESGLKESSIVPKEYRVDSPDSKWLAAIKSNVHKSGIIGNLVASNHTGAIVIASLLEPYTQQQSYLRIQPKIEEKIRQIAHQYPNIEMHIIGQYEHDFLFDYELVAREIETMAGLIVQNCRPLLPQRSKAAIICYWWYDQQLKSRLQTMQVPPLLTRDHPRIAPAADKYDDIVESIFKTLYAKPTLSPNTLTDQQLLKRDECQRYMTNTELLAKQCSQPYGDEYQVVCGSAELDCLLILNSNKSHADQFSRVCKSPNYKP